MEMYMHLEKDSAVESVLLVLFLIQSESLIMTGSYHLRLAVNTHSYLITLAEFMGLVQTEKAKLARFISKMNYFQSKFLSRNELLRSNVDGIIHSSLHMKGMFFRADWTHLVNLVLIPLHKRFQFKLTTFKIKQFESIRLHASTIYQLLWVLMVDCTHGVKDMDLCLFRLRSIDISLMWVVERNL